MIDSYINRELLLFLLGVLEALSDGSFIELLSNILCLLFLVGVGFCNA